MVSVRLVWEASEVGRIFDRPIESYSIASFEFAIAGFAILDVFVGTIYCCSIGSVEHSLVVLFSIVVLLLRMLSILASIWFEVWFRVLEIPAEVVVEFVKTATSLVVASGFEFERYILHVGDYLLLVGVLH